MEPARTPHPPSGEKAPTRTHWEFATRVLIVVGIITAVGLLLALLYFAIHIFLVLFAAVLFAVFLSSLSAWLSEHTPLPYGWSLVVVCLLLVALITGFFMWLAPQLSQQAQQLSQQLPQSLQSLQEQVRQLPFGEQILSRIPSSPQELLQNQAGSGQGGKLVQRVFSFFSSSLGVLIDLLIIIVIGIYLASTPTYMKEGVVRLVPIRKRDRAREVMDTLGFTLWGWLKGTFVAMVVIGTITTIGLSVIGVPLALLLGVFAGLLEFIPNIGPFIAGLPAVLLALTVDPTKALYVIGLFVVIQSLEGYILTPLVQKQAIDLPPVLTITAQLVMGLLVGFMGLLLAMPLIAVIMVLVKMLYIEDVLGDTSIEVKGEERAKEMVEQESREHA
jgi:predicted PurR-regulated permease PerM